MMRDRHVIKAASESGGGISDFTGNLDAERGLETVSIDAEKDIDVTADGSVADPEIVDDSPDLSVPDGGYGWVIVCALFLFNFSTWGANAAYAVYLAHYLNYDVFPGVTRIQYGAIGGLTFGSGLIVAPLLNFVVGIVGVHAVIGAGVLLQFAGLMMASFSTRIWELYLTQGFLLGLGMGTVAVPNLVLMPQWFRKKRSLAIGLSASGSGAGGVCFSLGMQHLIKTKGYQWALRIESIVCVAAQIIALLLTRTRSHHIKAEFKLVDRLTLNFGFMMDASWVVWTILGYVVLLYNLADFTVSLGYTSEQSATVSTMISVAGFFFRPVVGRLSDRFGAVTVNIYVNLLVSLFAFAMWIPCRNYATAIAFAFIEGALMGSIWVVTATIATRIAGLQKMGSCLSTLWIFIGISGIISPIIGISLKETLSDSNAVDPRQYLHPAIFVGCCYFAAGLSLFILRGWLIARDELMQEKKEHGEVAEDTGEELHITVPFRLGLIKCFQLKSLKKV